jgi:hypothetical protein
LGRAQTLILAAIAEIGDVHLLVYQAITDAEKEKLRSAIKALEDERAALQAAYEKNKDSPGILATLAVVVDAGKDLTSAIGNVEASNWLQVGQDLKSALQKFGSVVAADRVPADAPSFAELDDQIKKARANLDQFVDNVSNTMKEIIGSQNQNLQQLIATRDRIEQRRTQVRFLFDDLVRLSMQEYLQTGNEEVLNKNLDTIRDMFDEAKVPSFLSLQSIRHLCDGPVEIAYEDAKGKVGCLVFKRTGSPYVVKSLDKRAPGLPLIVVKPGPKTITRSFDEAFDAKDLSTFDPGSLATLFNDFR